MLNTYRRLAWVFDELFRIPGTQFRFGLDSVIGLVPGVGDLVVSGVGAYALLLAFKLRAPVVVLARMLGNIAVDTLIGSIPLIGDVFDTAWKANTKNRRVLEAWLDDPARTERRSKWAIVLFASLFVALVVASLWITWLLVTWILGLLAGPR